jgi:SAM-dependent methyltransferase
MNEIDHWEEGDAYDKYIGRWSRRVAPKFLARLEIPDGLRWLDVGCGTGALSSAILEHCAPSELTGVEPSAGFREAAGRRLGERSRLLPGSATSIPLEGGAVDVAVAGLVLNFVDDQPAAVREMSRVCAPGGTVAAYVWDYGGGMELIHRFWQVARALDPRAAELDEAVRFPLCREGALKKLFESAGLERVESWTITIDTPFASFEEYWRPFLGAQGPAPAYVHGLDHAARERLRDALLEDLRAETSADGSISLVARAHAARGAVVQG